MLTSFDSRLNESARIFDGAGGSFGRASSLDARQYLESEM